MSGNSEISGWDIQQFQLPMPIIKILIRGGEGSIKSQRDNSIRERLEDASLAADFEDGGRPSTKECRLPPEAGKGKEPVAPLASPGGMQSDDPL